MAKNIQIPVRVTEDKRAEFHMAAKALGTTVSEIALDAWERAVKRAEKKREAE